MNKKINTKKKSILAILFILLLSFTMVACSNETEDTSTQDEVGNVVDEAKESVEDAAKDVEDNVRSVNYQDIKITPEEAFDKYMELHPGSKIKEIGLDKELMDYEYVIEGYDNENEYEVKIDPLDGSIKEDKTDEFDLDSDDEKDEITKIHLAKVDVFIEKAMEEDGSNSELDEWNISIDDRRIVLDIEIGATEYSYDLESEKLIEKDM